MSIIYIYMYRYIHTHMHSCKLFTCVHTCACNFICAHGHVRICKRTHICMQTIWHVVSCASACLCTCLHACQVQVRGACSRVHELALCACANMCHGCACALLVRTHVRVYVRVFVCRYACARMHVYSSPRLKIHDAALLDPICDKNANAQTKKPEPSRPEADGRTTTQAERINPRTST